jgi:spore maturation protein B
METVRTILDWSSVIIIPLVLLLFLSIAVFKRVKVYDKFLEGAKEGFQVVIRIIPYLVGMLVAIGMFRASGALDILTKLLSPVTGLIGMPSEVLPMALMRPLSGNGSLAVMVNLMDIYGPDSLIGFIASTMFGSSETTFYVVAVYFGSINVQKTRYALPAGLAADAIGLIMAALICRAVF